MKKTLLLFSLFCTLFISASADVWTENFDDQTSNSYSATSYDINGRTWTASNAGNFSYCNTSMGSYGFTINDDKAGAHITTPALNTLGAVSFKYAFKNGNNSNVFLIQTSIDGLNFSTIDTHTLGAGADENWVNYTYNVNSTSATTYLRILSDDQNAHLFIDDFSVTSNGGAALPLITVSTNSITDLNYDEGSGPSSSQSFTVAGSDLTANIVVTPSANFEISTNNTTFQTTSITATQTAGSVAKTNIYARLVSGLTTNNYTGTITVSSSGASDKTINVSGQIQGAQTTSLPYSEDFSSGFGKIYTFDAAGNEDEWYLNGSAAAVNGFPNDNGIDNDWLILPGIDFSAYSNVEMTFDLWWKYGNQDASNYLKLKYSNNYAGIGDPSAATWTSLTYTEPETAEVSTTTGPIDLSSVKGTSIYIAFEYQSDDAARNWVIDNILVQEAGTAPQPLQPNAWINEIHYDNAGTDSDELIEIVIEDATTYSLADFQVDLYNDGGSSYNSETVNNFSVGQTLGDYTLYYWKPGSIQNGGADGMALSYQGSLITGQLLSYEGTFTAIDGPAKGTSSEDIKVFEDGNTPVGNSLQLVGQGLKYGDFTWVDPVANAGAPNNKPGIAGQVFAAATPPVPFDWRFISLLFMAIAASIIYRRFR